MAALLFKKKYVRADRVLNFLNMYGKSAYGMPRANRVDPDLAPNAASNQRLHCLLPTEYF